MKQFNTEKGNKSKGSTELTDTLKQMDDICKAAEARLLELNNFHIEDEGKTYRIGALEAIRDSVKSREEVELAIKKELTPLEDFLIEKLENDKSLKLNLQPPRWEKEEENVVPKANIKIEEDIAKAKLREATKLKQELEMRV